MSASAAKNYRQETRLVQAGILRSPFGETSEALYLTQGYVYDTAAQAEARFKGEDPGYQYSRFANPTVDMFERRMASLEGAEAARATATGMAAVTLSLVGQLKAGDHVVGSKAMFGSCRYVIEDYLPRFGVASTLVDGCNLDAWRNAVRPNTKTFFLESPTNPALDIIDIAEVAKIAHAAGATLVVDNVFATPLYQSPLALGADCVVYSATKHIDGQGRCLGGVVLGSQKFIMEKIHTLLRQTGPSMSPFNAWVLLKGLETLAVRVRRQTDSAATLAVALAEHPEDRPSDLSGPARSPAGCHRAEADARRLDAGGVRDQGRQAGGFPVSGCSATRPYQQQSWRCQEPHHPSGYDHPPAADARGTGRTRHQRRPGARLGRPRTSRRYRRRRARRPGDRIIRSPTARCENRRRA